MLGAAVLSLVGLHAMHAAGGQTPGTPQDKLPPKPVEVKFELLRSLHIAVPVKVNDAGPFRLIFDLGSPVVLVSNKMAAAGGMISPDVAKRPAFFGMRGEMKAKKLAVGDVVAHNVPVTIMDHPTIQAAAQFLGPIDGIVGYPFFARYRFTIDYPATSIVFTPNQHEPENVMQKMMRRMLMPRTRRVVAPASLWGLRVDKAAGDQQPGIDVAHVWPNTAAESAGLKPGDRILTIDGRWSDSAIDAADAASFVKPGQLGAVRVRRGDKTIELPVRPRVGI
jgi:hypothetical protein